MTRSGAWYSIVYRYGRPQTSVETLSSFWSNMASLHTCRCAPIREDHGSISQDCQGMTVPWIPSKDYIDLFVSPAFLRSGRPDRSIRADRTWQVWAPCIGCRGEVLRQSSNSVNMFLFQFGMTVIGRMREEAFARFRCRWPPHSIWVTCGSPAERCCR